MNASQFMKELARYAKGSVGAAGTCRVARLLPVLQADAIRGAHSERLRAHVDGCLTCQRVMEVVADDGRAPLGVPTPPLPDYALAAIRRLREQATAAQLAKATGMSSSDAGRFVKERLGAASTPLRLAASRTRTTTADAPARKKTPGAHETKQTTKPRPSPKVKTKPKGTTKATPKAKAKTESKAKANATPKPKAKAKPRAPAGVRRPKSK